ncbi:MAG TPA: LysM peptidoglycan-binding domain-containing protein [Thermohalobaculum sp.]|nr:LysM peptidoglycan-binding domain-containing protein [Thermohalobaculum sp.]
MTVPAVTQPGATPPAVTAPDATLPDTSPTSAPPGSAPTTPGAPAEAGPGVSATADPGAAAPVPRPADPGAGRRFALSAPVVILPSGDAGRAPAVVQSDAEAIWLLQPTVAVSGAGIVLDRITYDDAGAIVAAGRGRPGSAIRVYANAALVLEARGDPQGQWRARIPHAIASGALLLRFDEIGPKGEVLSRLETPFEYAPEAVAHELRQRRIVVQQGDYLWKYAEQHYGRGIRYSVIYQANAHLIRDPDLIYPGQVFTVPELVDGR